MGSLINSSRSRDWTSITVTNNKMTRKWDKAHWAGTIVGLVIILGAFILRWHEGVQMSDSTLYKIIAVGALVMSPHILVDKIRQIMSKGGK